MGVLRWLLLADGVFGGDLGPGLCLQQFDAAGPPRRSRPSACFGVGVAQYVVSVCGAGDRVGDRRITLCGRSSLRHRLCGGCLCRAGANHRDPDEELVAPESLTADFYRLSEPSTLLDANRVSDGVNDI